MKLVRRSNRPVAPFTSVLDNFFNDEFFNFPTQKPTVWNRTMPAVNIKESDDQYDIEIAVPGKEKSDFNIKVDQDVLSISSEVKNETEDKAEDGNWTRKEFSYSTFKRSFNLPETVAADKIEANYVNGILKVVIPKKEEAKPQPTRLIEVA